MSEMAQSLLVSINSKLIEARAILVEASKLMSTYAHGRRMDNDITVAQIMQNALCAVDTVAGAKGVLSMVTLTIGKCKKHEEEQKV